MQCYPAMKLLQRSAAQALLSPILLTCSDASHTIRTQSALLQLHLDCSSASANLLVPYRTLANFLADFWAQILGPTAAKTDRKYSLTPSSYT